MVSTRVFLAAISGALASAVVAQSPIAGSAFVCPPALAVGANYVLCQQSGADYSGSAPAVAGEFTCYYESIATGATDSCSYPLYANSYPNGPDGVSGHYQNAYCVYKNSDGTVVSTNTSSLNYCVQQAPTGTRTRRRRDVFNPAKPQAARSLRTRVDILRARATRRDELIAAKVARANDIASGINEERSTSESSIFFA